MHSIGPKPGDDSVELIKREPWQTNTQCSAQQAMNFNLICPTQNVFSPIIQNACV